MSRHQHGHVGQTLRRATAAAHHALDHHPLMQRLVSSDLTREQYAESLAAMYLPHARLERLVHGSRHHLESGLGLSARRELLEADLSELGWPLPPISPIPDPQDGLAAWWGRVYVLEGSRQGSAVLIRFIHSSLGVTVPSRFFGGVATVSDHHGGLLATLERELQDPDDLEQAVASARAAFAAYEAELDAFHCRQRPETR